MKIKVYIKKIYSILKLKTRKSKYLRTQNIFMPVKSIYPLNEFHLPVLRPSSAVSKRIFCGHLRPTHFCVWRRYCSSTRKSLFCPARAWREAKYSRHRIQRSMIYCCLPLRYLLKIFILVVRSIAITYIKISIDIK